MPTLAPSTRNIEFDAAHQACRFARRWKSEFDTVAAWTADVAIDLGRSLIPPYAGILTGGTFASPRWLS